MGRTSPHDCSGRPGRTYSDEPSALPGPSRPLEAIIFTVTFMCYNFILFSLLMAVSLASINVNGAAERHKRLEVFGCLRAMPVDLFLLQETHLADFTQGKACEKDWGGQCTWSPGSNRSAGVTVLIHPNSAAKLVDSKTDLAGRVVTALIDFHGQCF